MFDGRRQLDLADFALGYFGFVNRDELSFKKLAGGSFCETPLEVGQDRDRRNHSARDRESCRAVAEPDHNAKCGHDPNDRSRRQANDFVLGHDCSSAEKTDTRNDLCDQPTCISAAGVVNENC